jgi:hypothetical protein
MWTGATAGILQPQRTGPQNDGGPAGVLRPKSRGTSWPAARRLWATGWRAPTQDDRGYVLRSAMRGDQGLPQAEAAIAARHLRVGENA